MAQTQKMFIAEAEICLGNPIETIELTRSYPCRDAADNFIADPIWNVLQRAADELRERMDNGEFSSDQIISITFREMKEDEHHEHVV